MNEHDLVVLTRSLPESGLEIGDVGTIVHIYDDGKAFEVEFVSGDGTTLGVITLEANDVRSLGDGEILHVRRVAA